MLELPKNQINYFQLKEKNKWSIEEIKKFQDLMKDKNDFNDLLNIIYDYHLTFNQITSLDENHLHKIGLNNYFKGDSKARPIEKLLEEHSQILKEKQLPIPSKNEDFEIIQRIHNIKFLSQNYIGQKLSKNSLKPEIKNNDDELIAIAFNAVKEVKGFELNDSQMLCLISLLNKNYRKGKIAQVLTGEGKTIIINCLALILVLKGHVVDIVTSNPFLAIRDEEESKKLFKKFDISVAHNIKDEYIDFKAKEKVYSCDVIFGTTLEYQGDFLYDEYKLKKIRNNRKFDVVIVDEIDCMLVDQYNHSTLLSSSIPFMENYSAILQLLWACYKRLKLDDEQILNDNELKEKLITYLKKNAKSIINKKFKTHLLIPMCDNARDFAFEQIDIWMLNFIISLESKIKVEYIINDEGKINPVDNKITGVICKNTVYNGGLYQYLQMKNDLPVTPISITTNYLSNFGFFKKYIQNSNNIYGLTGTIGDSLTMKILENLYQLDFDYIPPEKIRKLKELESKICLNHALWIENIINIVKREAKANRALLILSESIENADEIFEEIQKKISEINLIKIIGKDSEGELIKEELESKSVIVSTNISGRGTDIKLSKDVINNGGLHVIITFIPDNIRVEEQNYGRAGRQGQPGTWQLVINYQEIIHDDILKEFYKQYIDLNQVDNLTYNFQLYTKFIYYFTIDFLRKIREDRTKDLFKVLIKNINKVGNEDKLFNNYVKMINLKEELREEDNKIYLDSIEEQWGIFSYKLKKEDKDWNQLEKEFNNFQRKIITEYENNKDNTIKNPGFCNRYVNESLSKLCFKKKILRIIEEIVKTLDCFVDINLDSIKDYILDLFKSNDEKKYLDICEIAISFGKDNSFIPSYLRAICRIILKEKDKDDDISKDLENSIIIINKEINRYSYMYKLLKNMNINSDFPFYQMLVLSKIKKLFEKNFKDFKEMKDSDIILDEIDLSKFILKKENNENGNKFLRILEQNIQIIKDNGLGYIFSLDKKSFIWEFRDFFAEITKLVITSLINKTFEIKDYIKSISKLPFKEILKKIYNKFLKQNPNDKELELKNEEYYFDEDFQIFEEDEEFTEYLKNRKKIEIYKEYDLNQLLKNYDNDLDKKNKLVEEELNTVYMKKSVDRLCLYGKELELDKVLEFAEKMHNDNNILNDKVNKCINEIKKSLDKDKTKALLETYFLKLAGQDIFKNGYKDINNVYQKMKENKDKLNFANMIINKIIQNQIINHIKEEENIWNLTKSKINEKLRVLEEKRKNHNNKVSNYNSKKDVFNEKVRNVNEMIKNNNVISNKECENIIENIKKEGDNLEKEFDQIELDNKNLEIEFKNINKEIEECNKKNEEINNKIIINNNFEDNMDIDFEKEAIIIKFKNPDLKFPQFEQNFRNLEQAFKLIIDEEIKEISKNIIYEEYNQIIYDKILKYEEIIEKIINEKNQLFNNCFNKSFSKSNYIFDSDDMNKIINYNLNKSNISKDLYYISEIYDKKNFDQAKNALENKKIVLGNFQNRDNNWTSFSITPRHSPYTFLYKSSNGEEPSYELEEFVKNITGNYYNKKINKLNINNTEELTEVNAIENIKIMIQEIEKNKNEFIKNFEKLNNFYTDTKKNKEELKYKIYPNEYIKSLYNEMKIKTNSTRVSLGLFKYYYLDNEKNNPIVIEYLNKIYEILMNNNEIEDKEKDILKKEYNQIQNVYEQYKINEEEKIKKELQKKEEEEKRLTRIIFSPNEEKEINDNNKTKEENHSINNKINENNDKKKEEENNNNFHKNKINDNKDLNQIIFDYNNDNDKTQDIQILESDISFNKEKNIINNEKDLLKQKNSKDRIITEKPGTNGNNVLNENIKLKINYDDNSSERIFNNNISNQNKKNNGNREKGCLERFCDCLKSCCHI